MLGSGGWGVRWEATAPVGLLSWRFCCCKKGKRIQSSRLVGERQLVKLIKMQSSQDKYVKFVSKIRHLGPKIKHLNYQMCVTVKTAVDLKPEHGYLMLLEILPESLVLNVDLSVWILAFKHGNGWARSSGVLVVLRSSMLWVCVFHTMKEGFDIWMWPGCASGQRTSSPIGSIPQAPGACVPVRS